MRIVLMGTGPFAGPMFEDLLASGEHEVLALVTRPEAPAAGRKSPPESPMRRWAAGRLPVLDPASINSPEAHALLRPLAADLFVVCDYGQILSADTLRLARLGGINLHGSLLPRYRGAAPLNWAIWRGETTTGVTVIWMSPQLDAGPILAVRETPIGEFETAEELEPRLAALGVPAARDALRLLAEWDGSSPLGRPQDPALATSAPRLRKEQGRIDWECSAAEIVRQWRALQPWPGTHFVVPREGGDDLRVIVRRPRVVTPDQRESWPAAPDAASRVAGEVVRSDGGCLWVASGEGWLSLERVQPAGKRELDAAEFLRGRPLAPGQRLG